MSKLELKGHKKNHDHHPQTQITRSEPAPTTIEAPVAVMNNDQLRAPTPEEIHAAWEKIESYVPKTEEALGEVLEAFLEGRRG